MMMVFIDSQYLITILAHTISAILWQHPSRKEKQPVPKPTVITSLQRAIAPSPDIPTPLPPLYNIEHDPLHGCTVEAPSNHNWRATQGALEA